MAFETETGNGSATANSYLTVVAADTYFSDRSNTTWSAATNATKEAALIKASQYVDQAQVWKGTRANETQSMKWPRIGVYDEDDYYIGETTIPQALKNCVCEFAVLVVSGVTLITRHSKSVLKERVEGAVSREFDKSSPDGNRYDDLWLLVSGLTTGSSLMGVTVRA